MGGFSVAFAPSRLRRWGAMCFGAWLFVLVAMMFSGSLKIVLLLAILATTALAWREPPLFVRRLVVDEQGFAAIFADDLAWEVKLGAGSFITSAACCLKWETSHGVIWQWVFADMLSAEDWRRLVAWAKYGQPSKKAQKERENTA
ncbi:hypothetical protein QDY71_05775 [Kingella negevensis]|nr:protein YgfX [Kingella negevensis]MDK4681185.1 hypothetical protein [Kingella negevensis]MDK4683383.1 hypothetical protein [Kingella negevensis]MDK4691483.1 hypothetical protein [Kingella negevensis]MDK4693367.1 hypothetical protein [Kingella negevensis]MDK4697265.1 hypothetical protein [Kingella negevensis]